MTTTPEPLPGRKPAVTITDAERITFHEMMIELDTLGMAMDHLSSNDPEVPDTALHVSARFLGLNGANAGDYALGEFGGTSYADFAGDVFAVWHAKNPDTDEKGVVVLVNGRGVFIPVEIWSTVMERSRLHIRRPKRHRDPAETAWDTDAAQLSIHEEDEL